MFFRQKRSGNRVYLQIVENRWGQGRSKQRVIATLGRLDRLSESGQLDALLQSGAKFSESVMVLGAHREGEAPVISTRRIGPALRASGKNCKSLKSSAACSPVDGSRCPSSGFCFSPCCIGCLLRGATAPACRFGNRTTRFPAAKRSPCTRSTVPWLSWESRYRKTNNRVPRPFRRARRKTLFRKPCSTDAATCSVTWNWSSSIRRRSTSRAKAEPTWDNTGTARIIARTANRWSLARSSTPKAGRSVANCGPATSPM